MALVSVDEPELVTILILAAALGMDALSLGVGIGMKGIRLKDVLKLSVTIAVFHTAMPLLGMLAGHSIGSLLGGVAAAAGGGLLAILGLHMIYSSLRGEEVHSVNPSTLPGLLLLAAGVSVDSLSVGVSLGMFDADMILTVLLFGAFGGLMAVAGLLAGRKVSFRLGRYGEALGGMILLAFGVKFLI